MSICASIQTPNRELLLDDRVKVRQTPNPEVKKKEANIILLIYVSKQFRFSLGNVLINIALRPMYLVKSCCFF